LLIIASLVAEPLRARIRSNALVRLEGTTRRTGLEESELPKIVFLSVYRAKNVRLVQVLLRELGPDADVRLWALDEVAPDLAAYTVGSGPGTRFAHFNNLYRNESVEDDAWVVLADDDALFVKGSLVETIDLMKRSQFSLAQPSHSVIGWWTSMFNVARPFSLTRETNYVEQGPVVIMESSFAREVLPLPEDNDMGWGIEAEWYRLKEGRRRIGVVDSCRIAHWGRNATSYPKGPEMINMRKRLTRAGVESIWQLQTVNGHWWRWQRTPPWVKH
jgi:hypothetical protein